MGIKDIQWEAVPFGPEWEKEVMKLTKKDIIQILRKACIEKIEQEDKVYTYTYFISYALHDGYGNIEMTLSQEITEYSDINELGQRISQYLSKDAIILNYNLLRKEIR